MNNKCKICGAFLEEMPADIKIKGKDCTVTISDIFAYRCSRCGKTEYREKDLNLADEIKSIMGQQKDGRRRSDVSIGSIVDIVLKADQGTDKRTRGHVARILTNKSYHPRGIKVMLQEDDLVGRVQEIF